MTRHGRSIQVALLVLSASLLPRAVRAQTPHQVTRTPTELLQAFKHEYQTNTPSRGSWDVAHALAHPDDYPAADMQRFIDGLEQLDLTPKSGHLK
jgi:hypothetical protein